MPSHRIEKTSKETVWAGGMHQHVAALCVEGRRVSKWSVIANIRAGTDAYYTDTPRGRAEVTVVDQCARCATPYLRTTADATAPDNLLRLRDC